MKPTILLSLLFPTILHAAAPTTPGSPALVPLGEKTIWELLVESGWVMIPLLLVSVAAVALIIFYFATLRASRIATPGLKQTAEALIREKNFAGLLAATRESPEVLARVMEQTARFLHENPEADFTAVREVAQAEGARQVSALNQQVVYLMDVGVLSPMLGLFGTVVGILRSFGSIAGDAAVVSMRATVLAGGVSQALMATAVGLVVGITSMFFYSYFRGRVQGLVSELETSASSLVALIGLKLKA